MCPQVPPWLELFVFYKVLDAYVTTEQTKNFIAQAQTSITNLFLSFAFTQPLKPGSYLLRMRMLTSQIRNEKFRSSSTLLDSLANIAAKGGL